MKEIGCPQYTLSHYLTDGDKTVLVHGSDWGERIFEGDAEVICACPTLEELLEWVVGGRTDFRLYTDFIDKDYGDKGFVWRCGFTEVTQPYMLHHSLVCKTPLEAVYNLIIALHQYDPLPHPDSEGKF